MTFLNLEAFLRLLLQTFSPYEELLVISPDLISDIKELLKHSGLEKAFLAKLDFYLEALMQDGMAAIDKTSGLERLQNADGLCSMKFKAGAANVRILFRLIDGQIYLLLAFWERQGKGTTEYRSKIPTAHKRLQDLLD